VRGGQLVVVHPGVARFAAVPPGDDQQVLAAVLAVGRGAMASHTAAARVWGVPLDVWRPEVTVRDRARSPRAPGIVVHRPVVLLDLEPTRRRGIPVTTPLRLLVDLGRPGRTDDLELALDAFHTNRLVPLASARAVLERHTRRGGAGARALRNVLDRWALGSDIADSEFELVVRTRLARHGLPEPTFHHRIGRYEVDVAFPDALVAVEVDGWATHGRRDAFEHDRARDLELAARGWLVVRLTWWAVTQRPDLPFRRLRQVLERRCAA
jgi:very-short-patch-repair endonuclease